jgi:2-C-methyl-D-erythritol 2,4-cyclodiphosphate synthase
VIPKSLLDTLPAQALIDLNIRVGLGHDTHRLQSGGPLRLGGIDIDFEFHLLGHSDADVLLHAITDALLGASSLGDIGEHFPDNDPANKGRDSADMLLRAYRRVTDAGWRIINLDCVVLAERPKLLPHRPAIIARIAEILSISQDQIGLKGKTGEKSGEIGEGKIMQAICVCLLRHVER